MKVLGIDDSWFTEQMVGKGLIVWRSRRAMLGAGEEIDTNRNLGDHMALIRSNQMF
jgi:hypothetical protein